MIERRPALGKGLSALIPETPEPPRHGALDIDIDLLAPNEQQPRMHMDDARLVDLAESIKANGVLQPILVRRVGGSYRIIAGERRWRAAQRAGLLRVPRRGSRRSGRVGPAAARAGARRKSPAPRPQSGGRGARVPASRRGVRTHAGADRRGGRQGSQLRGELPATVEAAGRSARRPRVGRDLDGTRACPAGAPRPGRAAARRA